MISIIFFVSILLLVLGGVVGRGVPGCETDVQVVDFIFYDDQVQQFTAYNAVPGRCDFDMLIPSAPGLSVQLRAPVLRDGSDVRVINVPVNRSAGAVAVAFTLLSRYADIHTTVGMGIQITDNAVEECGYNGMGPHTGCSIVLGTLAIGAKTACIPVCEGDCHVYQATCTLATVDWDALTNRNDLTIFIDYEGFYDAHPTMDFHTGQVIAAMSGARVFDEFLASGGIGVPVDLVHPPSGHVQCDPSLIPIVAFCFPLFDVQYGSCAEAMFVRHGISSAAAVVAYAADHPNSTGYPDLGIDPEIARKVVQNTKVQRIIFQSAEIASLVQSTSDHIATFGSALSLYFQHSGTGIPFTSVDQPSIDNDRFFCATSFDRNLLQHVIGFTDQPPGFPMPIGINTGYDETLQQVSIFGTGIVICYPLKSDYTTATYDIPYYANLSLGIFPLYLYIDMIIPYATRDTKNRDADVISHATTLIPGPVLGPAWNAPFLLVSPDSLPRGQAVDITNKTQITPNIGILMHAELTALPSRYDSLTERDKKITFRMGDGIKDDGILGALPIVDSVVANLKITEIFSEAFVTPTIFDDPLGRGALRFTVNPCIPVGCPLTATHKLDNDPDFSLAVQVSDVFNPAKKDGKLIDFSQAAAGGDNFPSGLDLNTVISPHTDNLYAGMTLAMHSLEDVNIAAYIVANINPSQILSQMVAYMGSVEAVEELIIEPLGLHMDDIGAYLDINARAGTGISVFGLGMGIIYLPAERNKFVAQGMGLFAMKQNDLLPGAPFFLGQYVLASDGNGLELHEEAVVFEKPLCLFGLALDTRLVSDNGTTIPLLFNRATDSFSVRRNYYKQRVEFIGQFSHPFPPFLYNDDQSFSESAQKSASETETESPSPSTAGSHSDSAGPTSPYQTMSPSPSDFDFHTPPGFKLGTVSAIVTRCWDPFNDDKVFGIKTKASERAAGGAVSLGTVPGDERDGHGDLAGRRARRRHRSFFVFANHTAHRPEAATRHNKEIEGKESAICVKNKEVFFWFFFPKKNNN